MRIRLFLALSISLALLPLLLESVRPAVAGQTLSALVFAIGAELAVGSVIGLLARIFFLALQTMGVAIAQFIGLATVAGAPIEDEQMPEVATLLSLTATTLIFISGQHWELLRGLVDSYRHMRSTLIGTLDQLAGAFLVALRVASPFLIYSIIINFAVGITNKLAPQIPVYFIAIPFVTAGGLILLYATIDELLTGFLSAFVAWLRQG
jgi:flagellar biosynthetic protein FliR